MKTLSIKQPWASLIAHGIKDIENRAWKTNYRGRIYIHASGKYAIPSSMSNLEFFGEERFELIQQLDLFGLLYYRHYDPMAVIGEVDIVDCVVNHPSVWADKSNPSPDWTDGASYIEGEKPIWNWVLANPVLYEEPILNVKGKLSL